MNSYAKDIGAKAKEMKGEMLEPVAKGAKIGSKKLAEGSEVVSESARILANKTGHWADGVTGARRRRNMMWVVLGLTVLGAVLYLLLQSDES